VLLTQHRCFKIDVSLSVHRKICLPVASRFGNKAGKLLILMIVKCCSCLFYKFSPLSDNSNKMHNYNSNAGETIEHIISSCTVLAQSEYKKRHDIFAKIIHMNLAVKFNLLKDTQPHYIYKPESCLENDNYKLYFDRTVLTDIHIQHNRPDIIILNKQQKQAYLLDIAVPNSHNITQTYNTKINKYLELSVAMRNLWCLEKISILPFIISATGIVPQSLFKNLKILDLENTLVVEIQKGILLYSCHIVRKFLNIDTEHKTQKSQNAEARSR
jgi:hypothetical protein